MYWRRQINAVLPVDRRAIYWRNDAAGVTVTGDDILHYWGNQADTAKSTYPPTQSSVTPTAPSSSPPQTYSTSARDRATSGSTAPRDSTQSGGTSTKTSPSSPPASTKQESSELKSAFGDRSQTKTPSKTTSGCAPVPSPPESGVPKSFKPTKS